jgi:hypothetical protein
MFATRGSLFGTSLGKDLSQAISEAFPSEPPVGGPSVWLHRIEPEPLRDALSSVTLAFHGENLSEEEIVDAVQNLENERRRLELDRETRQGLDTPAERQAHIKRLREAKPDKHAKPPDDKLF